MKSLTPVVGLVVGVVLVFTAMILSVPKKGEVRVIDCTLSEISPDFTTEMREACRRARKKQT